MVIHNGHLLHTVYDHCTCLQYWAFCVYLLVRFQYERLCHQPPLFLLSRVAPAASAWWAPIRSPWPRWDTASSLWIR